MNLNSPQQAIEAVSQHLRTIHKPYAGAQFRLAFFHDGTTKRFLSAYVLFHEQHIPSRPQTEFRQGDDRKFIFVEHWCREQWEAVKLLSQLLSGEANIDGHRIEVRFGQSDFERRSYPREREFWIGHDLRSRRDHDPNWKEFRVPQGYLVRRGTAGYYGPDHAINDWIFNRDTWDPLAADVPDRDTVVTFFPDLRARILSADWRRPQLYLEVELKVPADQMELQILYADSKSQFQSVPLKSGEIKVDIPRDVRAFSVLLLDDSDNRILSFELDQYHTKFGKADPHAERVVRGSTLLDSADLAFVDPADISSLTEHGFHETNAVNNERQFMEMAIAEARQSVSEPDGKPHPMVGAVVVKDGKVLSSAHRGEALGNHAEFIALDQKLTDEAVFGATVYTTLEPCTTRNHPKIPCVKRIIDRKVTRVVVGMLDPDPRITGRGMLALRNANIAIDLFPPDLMTEIEELNRNFKRLHEQQSEPPPQTSKVSANNNKGGNEEPPTLLDLFKNDFSNTLKLSDNEPAIAINWPDASTTSIRRQVYMDFPGNTKFVGFYILASVPPSTDTSGKKTFIASMKLLEADAVQQTFDHLAKQLAIQAGREGQMSSIEDLTFSGRVLLYHDEFLSIPQKADIIKAYAAKSFSVQFMGTDYLGSQVVAWYQKHNPK